MARLLLKCGLLWGSLVLVACGGGTLSRSSVRSDAAERWNCPKSDITETQESPTVVRVTGCGRSGVYVCTMMHKSREVRHDPMRTEREASRIDAGASCRPALQQASDAR